ncbi:MAG: hypothetical protein KDN22_31720, partial [Verrucomicrobiae bacterium]|nr:hypothetical protein [Verrucomicrobiae bacterium]
RNRLCLSPGAPFQQRCATAASAAHPSKRRPFPPTASTTHRKHVGTVFHTVPRGEGGSAPHVVPSSGITHTIASFVGPPP